MSIQPWGMDVFNLGHEFRNLRRENEEVVNKLASYKYWHTPEDKETPFLAVPIRLPTLERFSENRDWRLHERLNLRQHFWSGVIEKLREITGFKQLDITSAALYEDDEENLREASKWVHPRSVKETPLGKGAGDFFVIPLEDKHCKFQANPEQIAKVLQELEIDKKSKPLKVIYKAGLAESQLQTN